MARSTLALVSVLIVVAGITGWAGTTPGATPQRVPATRDEALALIQQITTTIQGNGSGTLSLAANRKYLAVASATLERLLAEFDDAAARAASEYATIAPELAQPSPAGENACELMKSTSETVAGATAAIAKSRQAISDLALETMVPLSSCAAGAADRLRAAGADLLSEETKLRAGVAGWVAAAQAANQPRRTVMRYRNSVAAFDAMEEIADRASGVLARAERDYTDYEGWTTANGPRIAAVRQAAVKLGIEREVAELEARAIAENTEFAKLVLVFKLPGFTDRIATFSSTRADGAAKREALKAAAPRFECGARVPAAVDVAGFASELAGSFYRMDDTGGSWLAAADRCEKKKVYLRHVGLETTFVRVKVGETVGRPRLMATSSGSGAAANPADVSERAAWTGASMPFTPTPAQANMIFLVTATIDGRASTLTIYVEPAR